MAVCHLTPERLRELLDYSQDTGLFTWRVPHGRWGRIPAGTLAGTLANNCYLVVRIDNKSHLLHRLAWLHVHNVWPIKHLDHIDRNRVNNRITNLRECNDSQNGQNRTQARTDSQSGILGVHFSTHRQRWCASLQLNGKTVHLSIHKTRESARAAYLAAKARHHPFAPT